MRQWENDLHALVTTRARALAGYAYALCGNRSQAEDLVQEALVRVLGRLGRGPALATGDGVDVGGRLAAVEAYVRAAILTSFLDDVRSRTSHRTREKDLAPSVGSVASTEGRVAARVDVRHALALLPPRERACMVLRYYEDLTVPQIARATGLADGSVKRYLSDGSRSLREALADWQPEELRTGIATLAAEAVPEGETPAATAAEGRLRGRVLRRRVAGRAAVAAAVLIAVGTLGAGLWQLAGAFEPEPAVPVPSPSPTTTRSPSPTPTPSPSPTGTPTPADGGRTAVPPTFDPAAVSGLLVPVESLATLPGVDDATGPRGGDDPEWGLPAGVTVVPAECVTLSTVTESAPPGFIARSDGFGSTTIQQDVLVLADAAQAQAALDHLAAIAPDCEGLMFEYPGADPVSYGVVSTTLPDESGRALVQTIADCKDTFYCSRGHIAFLRLENALVRWQVLGEVEYVEDVGDASPSTVDPAAVEEMMVAHLTAVLGD